LNIKSDITDSKKWECVKLFLKILNVIDEKPCIKLAIIVNLLSSPLMTVADYVNNIIKSKSILSSFFF
jgi:hypothetical protein